jgi:hypothetical protein
VQVVVQVFIVPRVQASIRRHDRWEKNLIELVALVEDELPRAEKGFRWPTFEVRHATTIEGDERYDQQKLKAWRSEATRKQQEADKALGEVLARANRLVRYLALVQPKASYWRQLSRDLQWYRILLMRVDRHMHERLDDDAFEAGWDEVASGRGNLLKRIEEITAAMKPPPRRVVSQAHNWARRRVRKMLRLDRKPKPAVVDTPGEATT